MIFLSPRFTPKIIANNPNAKACEPEFLIITTFDEHIVVGGIHRMGGSGPDEFGISTKEGFCFSPAFFSKIKIAAVLGEF